MELSVKRTVTGLAGVILGLLVAVGANAPAQAAPAASPTPARDASTAAVSPGISPAAERVRYVDDALNYSCASGRACFAVWDPTRDQYKVFDLYACNTYSLSNWFDWGTFRNSQTGGAAVVLYDENGPLPDRYPPLDNYYAGDWTPMWRIKPC